MKKLFVTMISLLACGSAYALPVGNPSEASLLSDGVIWEGLCGDIYDPCSSWCDAWSIRVGFYGDYVFNRHLKVDRHGNSDVIEHASLYTNAGYIALNIWDRFDIFTTLGATNFRLDTNEQTFVAPGVVFTSNGRFDLETSTHFSWSVGARATLWECGCTSFGAEGQYFRTRPDIRRITRESTTSIYPDKLDLKYQEWQVGLGVSHRINMFVPYIAVKWSGVKIDFDNARFPLSSPFQLFDLNNQKHWGYAIGVSLVDCEKAALTVEGRFADEKALYVNGQVRF